MTGFKCLFVFKDNICAAFFLQQAIWKPGLLSFYSVDNFFLLLDNYDIEGKLSQLLLRTQYNL